MIESLGSLVTLLNFGVAIHQISNKTPYNQYTFVDVNGSMGLQPRQQGILVELLGPVESVLPEPLVDEGIVVDRKDEFVNVIVILVLVHPSDQDQFSLVDGLSQTVPLPGWRQLPYALNFDEVTSLNVEQTQFLEFRADHQEPVLIQKNTSETAAYHPWFIPRHLHFLQLVSADVVGKDILQVFTLCQILRPSFAKQDIHNTI